MGWILPAGLLGLAGCQLVFPLRDVDAPPVGDTSGADAFRPLVPPDGGAAPCGPAPAFGTWTFTSHTLSGFSGPITSPTFTADDRVAFTSNGRLYETPLGGPPIEVSELVLADATSVRFPGSTPDGNMIWFARTADGSTAPPSVGPYFALRTANGFEAQRADFGIVARQLIPSNVGFYAGSGRMIVTLEPNPGDRLILVELSTSDGLAWTRLDTLPFSDGSQLADLDATLSADGCVVVFRRSDAKTYFAERDPSGNFGMPMEIPSLAGVFEPALAPNNQRLWAVESIGTKVVDGAP